MKNEKFKLAVRKASKEMWNVLPLILGTILLISLANAIIPKSFYINIFQNNLLLDSFIGSAIGSILAGHPITSYIIGGELLKQGISLVAVTAFLVAWVTVGIIQLPAEAAILGKRFALIRNILSFISAIIIAFLTVLILGGF
ncbi:MAG: permease [Candidatus Nanoarchaeia archaeon]